MKLTFFLLILLTTAACGSNNQADKRDNTNSVGANDSISPSERDKAGDQKDSVEESEKTTEVNPTKNDTIFIKRTLNKNMYHAIFIEKKTNTKWFKWLTNFGSDQSHNETYVEAKSYIKKDYPGAFTNHNTFGLPEEWIPVYLHKGNYYTYAPSDWGNAGQVVLNKKEYIHFGWDLTLNPIETSQKQNNRKYEFGFYGGEIFRIYVIDPATMLCVFEYDNGSDGKEYKLYIPAKNGSKFNMIVNNCETQKQGEFQFENVDYKAMIEKIK